MKIIYWTGTGNTQQMADLILEGIKSEGVDCESLTVDKFTGNLKAEKLIVLGCPAMGSEVLEENEFQPFFDEIKEDLKGKKVALFGSYGWGDGEWMRNWEEELNDLGATVILDPLIVQNAPEDESIEECKEYGRKIAKV